MGGKQSGRVTKIRIEFGGVKFELSIKYPSRDIEYSSLEFRAEVQAQI